MSGEGCATPGALERDRGEDMKIRLSRLLAPGHSIRRDEAFKVEELASSMSAQGQRKPTENW